MDKASLVQVRQRARDLPKRGASKIRREPGIANRVAQRRASHELEHQPDDSVLVGLEQAEAADQRRMVAPQGSAPRGGVAPERRGSCC